MLTKNVQCTLQVVQPDVLSTTTSGYDIIVKVNGVEKTNYTYSENYIKFNTFDFNEYDIIEIHIKVPTGLITDTSISKFDLIKLE